MHSYDIGVGILSYLVKEEQLCVFHNVTIQIIYQESIFEFGSSLGRCQGPGYIVKNMTYIMISSIFLCAQCLCYFLALSSETLIRSISFCLCMKNLYVLLHPMFLVIG